MTLANAHRTAALLTFVDYCRAEAATLGFSLPAYLLDIARLSLVETLDTSLDEASSADIVSEHDDRETKGYSG